MTAPKPKTVKQPTPQGASVVVLKKRTDWEAVERDYRATSLTLRELADKHNCGHSAIANMAKRKDWKRDLTSAIRAATAAALIDQAVTNDVTNSVTTHVQNVTNVVMATAEMNKNVIMGHRKGLTEITSVKQILLKQIMSAAENLPDLAEVIEMVRCPDDNGIDRANDALRKAMSRSALVDDLKKLADVDEKVRKGEREAFSLNDAPEDPEGANASRYTDAERAVKLAYLMSQVPE